MKICRYLGTAAKDNISKYIEEYLPAEYENCLDGLNDILTEAWTMSRMKIRIGGNECKLFT